VDEYQWLTMVSTALEIEVGKQGGDLPRATKWDGVAPPKTPACHHVIDECSSHNNTSTK